VRTRSGFIEQFCGAGLSGVQGMECGVRGRGEDFFFYTSGRVGWLGNPREYSLTTRNGKGRSQMRQPSVDSETGSPDLISSAN